MSQFEGRVDVLSAHQLTSESLGHKFSEVSLDALDVLSNLRSIQGLFAASGVHDEGKQRAPKRRKVDHDCAASVPAANLEEDKSIVLLQIALDLVSNPVDS
jgi:hypothetical protein